MLQKQFDSTARERFVTDDKIGLLAVMDNAGYPHMVFINTLMALDEHTLTWGQFIQGLSKRLLPENRYAGFLVLTREMELWRGKALYDHAETTGEAFDLYNNKPLFRYNSYFGVGKVHFMGLQEVTEPDKLNVADIVSGGVLSRLAAVVGGHKDPAPAMNEATRALFGKLDSLKFIAYEDEDGYPRIVPCIQMTTAGTDRLVFSVVGFGDELSRIPPGKKVAVFCATMQLRTVMVKGTFHGVKRRAGFKSGVVTVELVYNTMPPESGLIYPREPLKAVTEF